LEERINPILNKMNLMMDKFDAKTGAPVGPGDSLIRFYADELCRIMLDELLEDSVHNL
jgi:hypothetical protein